MGSFIKFKNTNCQLLQSETRNVNFVDNFYQIISNFKFACSNDLGSFLPLCHEFGLKVFLIGSKFKNINLIIQILN